MIRWCAVPEICCMTDRQTGGWTDGQTDRKSDIERWVPNPKNVDI